MSDIGDDLGAFVPGQLFRIAGRAGGPLSGLTFAAKDLFDVAGRPTGGGNPDWASDPSGPDTARLGGADAARRRRRADRQDDHRRGLARHTGREPVRGDSDKPARAGACAGRLVRRVGGGRRGRDLCDIALGTDTGGSVRVPASFCGIYGIRPTHGRLDLTGMMAQAPSSDTTGWFARDAETFARVSSVLLGEAIPDELPRRLVIASRRLRVRRSRYRSRARTDGRQAAPADRRGARGFHGAAGTGELGAGAAHAAAVRGVADLSGLDRARQSALSVQRRAQSGRRGRRSRLPSAPGRA